MATIKCSECGGLGFVEVGAYDTATEEPCDVCGETGLVGCESCEDPAVEMVAGEWLCEHHLAELVAGNL